MGISGPMSFPGGGYLWYQVPSGWVFPGGGYVGVGGYGQGVGMFFGQTFCHRIGKCPTSVAGASL